MVRFPSQIPERKSIPAWEEDGFLFGFHRNDHFVSSTAKLNLFPAAGQAFCVCILQSMKYMNDNFLQVKHTQFSYPYRDFVSLLLGAFAQLHSPTNSNASFLETSCLCVVLLNSKFSTINLSLQLTKRYYTIHARIFGVKLDNSK